MSMMSIFSSFDALCAESFGQKVGFSWTAPAKQGKVNASAPADDRKATPSSAPVINESLSKSKEGNSAGPLGSGRRLNHQREEQVKKQQGRRTPRFAPEFDGVNCFETMVSF